MKKKKKKKQLCDMKKGHCHGKRTLKSVLRFEIGQWKLGQKRKINNQANKQTDRQMTSKFDILKNLL